MSATSVTDGFSSVGQTSRKIGNRKPSTPILGFGDAEKSDNSFTDTTICLDIAEQVISIIKDCIRNVFE
jgi:hypothetical protein